MLRVRLLFALLVGLGCTRERDVVAARPRSEFPLALRVSALGGLGSARYGSTSTKSLGGVLAADLAWRDRPGHEWMVSYEADGIGSMSTNELDYGSYAPERLRSFDQEAVLVGAECSPPGSGVHRYLQGAIGIGRMHADIPGWRSLDSVTGLAFSGCAGIRIIPDPGPLGFLLSARTSHVIARRASGHVMVCLGLGLTLHPR